MFKAAGLEFAIYEGPRFARRLYDTWSLLFCVLNASKTGLFLVVILRRNVVMMYVGSCVAHDFYFDTHKKSLRGF